MFNQLKKVVNAINTQCDNNKKKGEITTPARSFNRPFTKPGRCSPGKL